MLLQGKLHAVVKKVESLATVMSCRGYNSRLAGDDPIQTVVENLYKMSLAQARWYWLCSHWYMDFSNGNALLSFVLCI